MKSNRVIWVLVIDDSAYTRRAVAGFLDEVDEVTVIGKASDGQEGLQLALTEEPDVITLDLEMPRMDGFSFLRLLMSKRPTPVIVISSHAAKENVFRALELGALDFVAKPTHHISPQIQEIRDEVVRKVLVTRHLKRETLQPLPPYAREHMSESGSFPVVEPRYESIAPDSEPEATRLVVIAASTGGPAALTRILAALPGNLDAGVLVVQHMPSRFTTTFAERLNRQCELNVIEPDGQQVLRRGTVHIAPGDRCIEVHHGMDGLVVRVVQPNLSDRYTPSADRLFASAAKWMRRNLLAVVLTGMGDDGKAGVEEVAGSGGLVIAESEETAVVDGMPRAAIATGVVTRVERLERLAELIEAFAGRF